MPERASGNRFFAISKSLVYVRAAQDLPELWLRVWDLLRVTRRLRIAGMLHCLPTPLALAGASGGETGATGRTGELKSGSRLCFWIHETCRLHSGRRRCGKSTPCFSGVTCCDKGSTAPVSRGFRGNCVPLHKNPNTAFLGPHFTVVIRYNWWYSYIEKKKKGNTCNIINP